jgi:hypothetical protein
VSVLAILTSAGLGVALGVVLATWTPGASPLEDRSADAPSAAPPPEPSTSTSSSATIPASPLPSASASASASAAASPEECALRLFPAATFQEVPPLGFVCETPTFPASRRLKKLVVQSGAGSVNEAMREWSRLGYYQLGATAVLQQRCCPSPPGYELPPIPKNCKLEPAMDALRAWAGAPAESEIEALTDTFSKAARCVARGVEGKAFDFDAPSGGQDLVFRKTLERVR